MAYVVDGVVILILVIAAIIGYHRGFLQSLVQVVGCVAALVLAVTLSSPIATYVFDNWLAEGVETHLAETIEETVETTVVEQWDTLLESLPRPLSLLLENSPQVLESLEESGVVELPTAEAIAAKLMETAVRPLALVLTRCIAFFVLFAVFLLLAMLLTKLIKPLSELPVIHQADGALGAVMGLLKGAVFALAFAVAVQFAAATVPQNEYFSKQTVEDSYIVGWIAEQNPLTEFIN